MSNRNPNSVAVEKEYVFEIHGEITITDYSEEQAKEQLWDELPHIFKEAIQKDMIEIN